MKNQKKIANLIKNNWQAKLISILIAIGLWTYNYNMQHSTVSIAVPIQYKNIPDKFSFENPPPRFIKIKVGGKEENLNFSTGNLKATVDLKDLDEGPHEVSVSFDPQQLPENIEIVEQPSNISVTFEKIINKTVYIQAKLTGKLSEGYKSGRVIVKPRNAVLKGPVSLLTNINVIETEPIELSGIQTSFIKKIKLRNIDDKIQIISSNYIEVSVTIFQENITNDKIIENISITAHNLDPALEAFFSVKSIKLHLQGPLENLNTISSEDIICSVDLQNVRFDRESNSILPAETETGLPIDIKLLKFEEKLQILNIIPDMVSVRYKIMPEFEQKTEIIEKESQIIDKNKDIEKNKIKPDKKIKNKIDTETFDIIEEKTEDNNEDTEAVNEKN
ncbi:MAG: CdaR family protein [Spirochaetia bacterium]|nr:CdaR family protein [Spirochaetia bacterium]